MSDLEVIGAGFGRTGTLSFCLALKELGFGPVFHTLDEYDADSHPLHLWKKVDDGENVKENLAKIFAGYRATADWPATIFYKEFLELSPDAKVVLTMRDSPEAWEKSARETIFKERWITHPQTVPQKLLQKIIINCVVPFTDWAHVPYTDNCVIGALGAPCHDPDTDLVGVYNTWVEKVKATVPADKLLLFNVKEGWGPLCAFLGVPVPTKPFPRGNDAGAFKEMASSSVRNQLMGLLYKIVGKHLF